MKTRSFCLFIRFNAPHKWRENKNFYIFLAAQTVKMINVMNETDTKTAPENVTSELREPIWTVVSFDKREAEKLTYAEAETKIAELAAQKVPGLCILTAQAASKVGLK